MAVTYFYNPKILYGPYDISGDHNQTMIDVKADMLEKTVFGGTTHIFRPGLFGIESSGSGFVQFDDSTTPKAVDGNLFAEVGAAAKVFSLTENTTHGSVAYFMKSVADKYGWTLKNDELGKFEFSVKAAGEWSRGRLMVPLASRTSSSNGTEYQLGAVASGKSLYASLHVTEWNATTLDVVVRSAALTGMGSPTTRLSFAQASGVTSEFKSVAGPITDTFYDVSWTLSGTSASFMVCVGIR